MDGLAGEQHLSLETLLRGRVFLDLRQDCLESEMNTLELEVFDFVDLAHSALRDEANDSKAVGNNLSRLEAASPGAFEAIGVWVAGVEFNGGPGGARLICAAEQEWLLEKTSSPLVRKEQFFDALPEFGRAGTRTIKESVTLLRSAIQSGTEKLLDGLFLTGHDSHPEE
jgi:hypothetical protein